MTGSIVAVFQACAAASGRAWTPPKRAGAAVVMCPLHANRNTPALSISDASGLWNCHAGCGGGGLLDAPVAFGLANDRSGSARWLSERRLIPDADRARGAQSDRVFVPRATYTRYADLDDASRYFRTAALLDAYDVIGPIALRAARDYIATMRYQRERIEHDRFSATLASFARYTVAHPNGYDWNIR